MDAARWKQVESLFQSALDLPPDKHDAFLARCCADDAALEQEIRALLLAHQAGGRVPVRPGDRRRGKGHGPPDHRRCARVGESLATVEQHNMPLAEATTPSLEALKAFSTGWQLMVSRGHTASLPFFRRATEIDPDFATAYAWLGRSYGGMGESALASESTAMAWRLRDRATDQEKFFIDFSYYKAVLGDLEKAAETCRSWGQAYPRDVRAHALLAGSTSTELGRFEDAAEEGKKAIEVDPDHPFGYYNLAAYYVYRDRLAAAKVTLQQALDRKLNIPEFLILQYQIAFLNHDSAEMERLGAIGLERSDTSDWMSDQVAAVLAFSGQLQQARLMSRRAVEVAQQTGHAESAAQHEAGAAVREALFGNATEARQAARSTHALSAGRDAQFGAAVAMALSGESAQAQALADDLEQRFPQDTSVRVAYLPTLRALVALNRADPSAATALLQPAIPYELAWRASATTGFAGSLYSLYVRGQALLMAHQGAEAAAAFQKILDHRGIVGADPVAALARLQMARALALTGDTPKATTAYQEFLSRWKNADADIPILVQARAEYSRLRRAYN